MRYGALKSTRNSKNKTGDLEPLPLLTHKIVPIWELVTTKELLPARNAGCFVPFIEQTTNG